MKKRILSILLTLCMVLSIAPAAVFAEGTPTGTADDPILISSAQELKNFAERVNNGETTLCAKLTADIVLNDGTFDEDGNYTPGASGADAEEWTPIGIFGYTSSDYIPYSGTFDGGGYTIKGLYVNNPTGNAGLFGYVEYYRKPGSIQNITVEGYVSGRCAGGIVARSNGIRLLRCTNRAVVSGGYYSGGMIGHMGDELGADHKLELCFNAGEVLSPTKSGHTGGLIGMLDTNLTVSITNCANAAKLTGRYVGGLIGRATRYADVLTIKNCYSTAQFNADATHTGGIVGWPADKLNVVITNSYWLEGTAEGVSYGDHANTTLTNVAAKSKAEFADGTLLGLLQNGDADSPWEKCGYLNAAGMIVPMLSGQNGDTFPIYTAEDLKTFRDAVNAGNTDIKAMLMNDIDLGGEPWTPIANYTGTFDGNGKTISGLNVTGVTSAGLFGTLNGSAVVKNLTVAGSVEASNTNNDAYVGSIAAQIGGSAQIIDCVNNATVKAVVNNDVDAVYTVYAGGMAGHMGGSVKITGCINNGKVTADSAMADAYTGGMAGYTEGGVVIENCLNAAELSAVASCSPYLSDGVTEYDNIQSRPFAGGMVGRVFDVTITGCFNTGAVTARGTGSYPQQPNAGGMIGFASGGSVTVIDCGNTGTITANRNGYSVAGGIVGSTNASDGTVFSISHCYSTGEVLSDNPISNVGGIAGNVYASGNTYTISDCYWLTGSCGKDVGYNSGNTVSVIRTEALSKKDFANGTVLELLKQNDTINAWDVCGYVEAADMTLPLLDWQTLNARKYDIYITGRQITSLNQNDVLGDGTVSFVYDEVNKKGILTLNGVNIVCNDISDDYPIYAPDMENLEIVLNDENKIEAEWLAGIMADNLTFSGDGSIEISTNGNFNWPVLCDKTFTVNDGNVKISSVDYALCLDGALTVNGGTLELIASDEYGYAIDVGFNDLDVILGDDRIMITGTNPDGADAQVTDASEVDTIKGAKYVKILSKYIPITYNPGEYGAESASVQNKTYDEDFGLSDALFTRIGYKQIGWALSDGGDKAYALGAAYSGNDPLTLYPVWEVNTYTVTLNTNGGTIGSGNVTAYTYGVGATLPTADDMDYTGYTFVGWYDNEGLAGSPVTAIGDTETGDKKYWASWDANTYTVTLNTNGGTIDSGNVTAYTYGVGATLPTADDMDYTGYTFVGWYDNEGMAGDPVTAIGDTETGDKEYWASWDANTYTVTLNAGGGTIGSGNVIGYTYGVGATLPTADDMDYTGYTFVGWYDNEGMAGAPVTAIGDTETGDKEYWARWEINTYIVTVKPENDGLDIHITGYYGNPIGAPTLTRDGYEFIGWDKEFPTTMPAENMTITAQWRDIAAPTGEIKIAENGWKSFLNAITFGLFFKETQTVTITAADNSGEEVTIEYLLSNRAFTETELANKTFTAYSAPFNIDPDNEYVIYAKLTDTSGNVAYINTDGIVLDATAPVISGIEVGKTYCAAQTVTVDDKYIGTVEINGKTVTLDSNHQFALNPAEGEQTIVVTDKAGNKTTIVVTVNDGHTGGTANCTEKAICEVCGKSYGEPNASNHADLKHIDAKAATKTAEGNIEYWYCEGCGKYFADKDGRKEITKADTVTAKLPEEKPTSPATGDTSNLTLWIALLFISGGVVAATTIVGEKKKHSKE